jgi:uncharacterized protein (TIGR03067 family)
MRNVLPALGISLLFLGSAHSDDPKAVKKEIELLRGKWGLNDEVQFAIYGDESFEINIGGAHINGARKIDPTKKPKEITLTPDNSNKPLYGIYELKGDTLTLCIGEKRPTQFKAKEGVTLWTLKREKEKGK